MNDILKKLYTVIITGESTNSSWHLSRKCFYHGFYNNSMAQTFCTEHLHRNGMNTWGQNTRARMCTEFFEDVILHWMTGGLVTCYAYCMFPADMTSYYGKLFLKIGCPHKPRREATVAEVVGCSCLDTHKTFSTSLPK